jgi:hypothetical protein
VKNFSLYSDNQRQPRPFKLTVVNDDSSFSSTVAVDITNIRQQPVLYVIDEATHFAAVLFKRNVTSKETWRELARCWSHVYMGPPEFLRVYRGSNFVSYEFKYLIEASGVKILEAQVEQMSIFYVTCRALSWTFADYFRKLNQGFPNETQEYLLQMAVNCASNTMVPEGLCPALCIFGAIPRPARASPAPTQLDRSRAIDNAMEAI